MKNMKLLHTNYGNVLGTSCVKSRITPFLPLLATVLMLTFGGWSSVAWGEEYAYQHDEQLGASASKTDAVTFTTPTFTNTTGIDHISFGYNSAGDGIIIEYSLDGSNYAEWSRTNVSEGSISDDIPFDHPARNAVRFRLKANGKKGWHGVWGMRIRKARDVIFRSSYYSSGSKPFQITQDSVVFNLNVDNYYDEGNGHFYVHTDNTTASISWVPKSGYTIAVTGVTLNGYNANENHYYDWLIRDCIGYSYIRSHTASDNTEVEISHSSSTATHPYTKDNNSNVFPSGNAIGNNAYFKLRAAKGYKDADHDYSYEYRLKFASLRYTVTPPAPTLINGSSVTRSQFVEGRSNNTITLTDYFEPFNSGVSMSYVVKKKNGSGEYVTINSGYDITSNVFKTTVVGEYQIFANSNATGAFNASSSSSALAVTIEEVRPLTISVGTNELYVDGTTSMTITEQLNATEDVVFEYDEDFFNYNESTHVLTAKNDANASFSTIEKSIRVTQESDGEFAAVDMTINFTIKKYSNTLKCAWNNGSAGDDWEEDMNFDSKLPVKFSSSNTSGPAISVTPASSSVATYKVGAGGANPDTIITNFRKGTVTWTISQAEDYKYVAATPQTLTVNVDTLPSPGCLVANQPWNKSGDYEGHVYYFETEDPIALTGPGDKLTFDGATDGACVNPGFTIQYSTDGSNYSDITKMSLTNSTTYYSYGPYDIPDGTTHIRFKGEGSEDKYHRNLRVTRKIYLETKNAGGSAITSLDMPSRSRTGDATTATFCVDYSTCDDVVKLASDNSHITFANGKTTDQFSAGDSGAGRKSITLTYNSSETEDIAATVTIYTRYEYTTLTVNAETLGKLSTTLEYIGSDSYSVNADNIAATSLFQVRDQNGDLVASPVITLSSSNTDAINTVSSNTALDFLCGADDVRITASYAGDDDYAAASNSGTFYHDIDVTRNAASFTWSNVADDDKIHVWADSDIPSSIVSANTAINGFTSGNSDRLTVSGSKGSFTLHAGHKGEVTLTATSEGDCTYLNGTSSKTIVVEPCFHGIVWDQNFMALTASAEGEIDEEYTLDAYAVDSSNVATNVTIKYTLKGDTVASLDGTKLTVFGDGVDTLIATTVADDKYAVVSVVKIIRVRREGEPCGSTVLYDPNEHHFNPTLGSSVYTEYELTGPADSLSCYVRKYTYGTITTTNAWLQGWSTLANDWVPLKQIYEQVDNVKSTHLGYKFTEEQSTIITKIRYYNPTETHSKYVSNQIVFQKTYFNANVSSINRTGGSPVMVNTPFTQDIEVSYSDVPHIQYRLEGAVAEVLTLVPTETITNDCGDYGTYTFRLSGTFSKAKAYSTSHIYIYHSAGDTIDIPVNITVACNGTFKFQTSNGEWETSSNWTLSSATDHGRKPDIASEVDIKKTVTITSEVSAYSIDLTNNDAKLIIMPGGGLTVGAGGIVGATPAKLELRAGTEDPVKGKTGYLRISPHYTDTMPHAKVQMYSIGYYDVNRTEEDIASWQYVGTPIDFAGKLAKTVFTRSWIYSYVESTDTWVNNRKTLEMQPFVGYETTQYDSADGKMIEYPGQLVPNRGLVTIDLEYTDADHGHNLLANSFAAPIDITQLRDTDFVNAERTIYLFNTGSKSQADGYSKGSSGDAAGQFRTIAIGTASEMVKRFAEDASLPTTIAPMQGFCVNAQAKGAKFKLNYNKLVWNADYTSHAPTALRAPKHNADAAEEEEMPITGSMKMTLEANGRADNIYLLESERYIADFEDGYDAHKMESGTLNIFTVEDEDKLAIDATNSIIGTRVGVRTGEETAYTITFSYVDGEQEWALYDAETNEMIDITNDNTYTFFAEPNSNITERFMIVEREGAPAVTTGNDKVTSDVRAHKFIKDSQLFILKNGVLYDATGARVK